jgi:DNA-binding transcriptional ArsR family regulator
VSSSRRLRQRESAANEVDQCLGGPGVVTVGAPRQGADGGIGNTSPRGAPSSVSLAGSSASYLTRPSTKQDGFRTTASDYVHISLPFVSAYGDAGLGLLGDPTRRAIFELLARRPSSVQELADQLPISRPAVSQHLRVLRDGGLVVAEPEGTRRIYRLNAQGVGALRAWLEGVWDQALTDFHKAADQAAADHFDDHSSEQEQQ